MPWTYYQATGKSFHLHTNECLIHNTSYLPDCKYGTRCSEVMQDHFWKFNHSLLASVRSYGNNSEVEQHENRYEPEVILKIKSEVDELEVGDELIDEHIIPGPSGWKPKNVETVNTDEAASESCSTVVFGGKKSPILFNLPQTGFCDVKATMNGPVEESISRDDAPTAFDMSNVAHFDLDAPLSEAEVNSIGASDVTVEGSKPSLPYSVEKRRINFTAVTLQNSYVPIDGIHSGENLSGKEEAEDGDKCSASPGIMIGSEDEDVNGLVGKVLDKYGTQYEESNEVNSRNVKNMEKASSELPPTPNQNKKCRSSSQEKKCVHIHFHISPYKTKNTPAIQPSIRDFLMRTEPPAENAVTPEPPVNPDIRKTGDLKGPQAWSSLMNRMSRKSYSMQSVTETQSTTSSSNEQRSKHFQYGKGSSGRQERKCPFYKYIPDTSFVVDAFNYGYLDGITAYFLTHFHYDHYQGLTKSFKKMIYCNRITGNLVRERLKMPDSYLHILPMEESTVVHGVEVTLLEANHCPGAAMILFKLTSGQTFLHVGDFRAHPKMESYPALWNNPVHTLYLDTTYCNPMYSFPSQEEVIEKCVLIAEDHNQQNPKSFIAVGSYTIGKERVFKAIAEALNCKIWVSADKHRTLRCIGDQEILNCITSNKLQAKIHVLPMKELNLRSLKNYLETLKPQYDTVVGIKPTGWEHANNISENLNDIEPHKQGNVFLYGIPYSEHSSYEELKRFVQFVQPKKIIPTVNVGKPYVRKKMEADFQKWMNESPFSS
ncbi:uncharacterized protein LOC143021449 isoform X2 [Oratosquilla oratoria]